MKTNPGLVVMVAAALATLAGVQLNAKSSAAPASVYTSPFDAAFSPDGKLLAVSDETGGKLAIVDVAGAEVLRTVTLQGRPRGVAWSADSSTVYVAEHDAGTIAEVKATSDTVARRIDVGPRPTGVAIAEKQSLLLAANQDTHNVTIVNLHTGKPSATVALPREPFAIAVSPDETMALVTNLLPAGRANARGYTSVVSVIDLRALKHQTDLVLPAGSSNLRDVAIDAVGKWAYVTHTVGRTNLPTTQLERGWVNTNALSIIDLRANSVFTTLLLDHPMEGAADPWGVALSPDGSALWVAISGVHWVGRIDLPALHLYLEGKLPDDHRLAQPQRYGGAPNIWLRIKHDPNKRAELVNDLASLYAADLIQRIDLPGTGPRGLDVSPDGKLVATAMYFTGDTVLIETATNRVQQTIALGSDQEPDEIRRGQMIFHDARYAFQHWLSCATCHPNEARVDGLNWDMLNDGIGNPKNTKSLLQSHLTPPTTWRGIRERMEQSTEKGFHFLLRQPEPDEVAATITYLKSLKPEPSPYVDPSGQLSVAAKRGRMIFQDEIVGCAECHDGGLYTDMKTHNVGTRGELDKSSTFDTPALIEGWRTSPFLHDGSAATLHEVIVEKNKEDKHGRTSHLTEEQVADLVAYLLSL